MKNSARMLVVALVAVATAGGITVPANAEDPFSTGLLNELSSNVGVDTTKLAVVMQFVNDVAPARPPGVSTTGAWPEVDVYETRTAYGSAFRANGDPFIAHIRDDIHVHHDYIGLDQYVEWTGKSYLAWMGQTPFNADSISHHDEFAIRTVFGGASLGYPPSIELFDGKEDEYNAPQRFKTWQSSNNYGTIRLDGTYIYSAWHETRGYFILGSDAYRVTAEYSMSV